MAVRRNQHLTQYSRAGRKVRRIPRPDPKAQLARGKRTHRSQDLTKPYVDREARRRAERDRGAARFAEKPGGPFLREEGLPLFEARLPTPPILWLRLAVSLAVAAKDWRPSGWRRDLLRRVKSIFVFSYTSRWATG